MEQLSLQHLIEATGGRPSPGLNEDLAVQRISIDSRTLLPGDVFWALQGQVHDGHDFVLQAYERGAALCVVSEDRQVSIAGPSLFVNDPGKALTDLGRWYRGTLDALVIGVTGTVGKTTTRELIHAALSSEFQGLRSRKNFNNLIGLPLTLLDATHHDEFVVVEMGASRIGDIRDLASIASPEVGVVTAIGPAHLESFGSVQGIIQGKGELLESLPSTGFAVLPGDDPVLRQLADRAPCPVIFVGEGDDNQMGATRVRLSADGLQFRVDGFDFAVPVCGKHHLTNALCAIAIAREIGVRYQSIAQGLSHFQPMEGRTRIRKIGNLIAIDDTYNASPLSVEAACQLLSEIELPGAGRRIVVLGDMRELGEIAKHEHWKIGNLAAKLKIDLIVACGQHADDIARGAEEAGMKPYRIAAAPDQEAVKAVLDCWLEPGDCILVKGSRATRMERILDWLRERAALDADMRGPQQQRYCA